MEKTSIFEILVAILLGMGALGGGWAGYQSSQWGGTATEDYGKAATTATRASTQYNEGIAIANRDSALDIQAKQLVLSAMTTKDELAKLRDTTVAKYLYTQQMTMAGYLALGYPEELHVKDDKVVDKFTDELLEKGLEAELGEKYFEGAVKKANDTFAQADKTFEEGQRVSGYSTLFGLTGMLFTISLFLGGIALVIKNPLRYGFMSGGWLVLTYASFKLLSLPWYHA